MVVQQRVELRTQRGEAAGLHLHKLAVGAHQVDDKAADRNLKTVARLRQRRLERGVQGSLAQHADARHAVTG
jgi:hypothetical protein